MAAGRSNNAPVPDDQATTSTQVLFEGKPQRGRITRMIHAKGFGFIDVDGAEVFFHRSGAKPQSLFDMLYEGQEVTGKIQQGPKGLRAFDVQPVE
jgi:cold shock CspA family protein